MSIRVKKEFDVIMREMDEMMGDVKSLNPQIISFNVGGVMMEFEDVEIVLNNGFLKIIGDDDVSIIRYRDVCGYSLKSLHKLEFIDGGVIDESEVDDLWREMSHTPSTLPQSFLKMEIPHQIKDRIVTAFICEREGCDVDDIDDDEWIKEMYDKYMSHTTYEELNNQMRDYMWDLWNNADVLCDNIKSGIITSLEELKSLIWINNIISDYLREDERELLKKCGGSDDDE